MKVPTRLCALCETRPANHKNSHIIPKFFSEGLFEFKPYKHGYSIRESGRESKIQDIPIEKYIFCSNCEKSFSILETYCSLELERYNNIRHSDKFIHHKIEGFQFAESKNIDIKIYNLFIYSIVWRLSISQKIEFETFKLPKEDESELKRILQTFLRTRLDELKESVASIDLSKKHCHYLIRPTKKLRPPKAMMSASTRTTWYHEVHLVDYILFYFTDKDKQMDKLSFLDNNFTDKLVKLGLVPPDSWEKYNMNLISNVIERLQAQDKKIDRCSR